MPIGLKQCFVGICIHIALFIRTLYNNRYECICLHFASEIHFLKVIRIQCRKWDMRITSEMRKIEEKFWVQNVTGSMYESLLYSNVVFLMVRWSFLISSSVPKGGKNCIQIIKTHAQILSEKIFKTILACSLKRKKTSLKCSIGIYSSVIVKRYVYANRVMKRASNWRALARSNGNFLSPHLPR